MPSFRGRQQPSLTKIHLVHSVSRSKSDAYLSKTMHFQTAARASAHSSQSPESASRNSLSIAVSRNPRITPNFEGSQSPPRTAAPGRMQSPRRCFAIRFPSLTFALTRAAEALGTPASNVTAEPERLPEIPWTAIVATRNRRVVTQFDVGLDIPLATASRNIATLPPARPALLAPRHSPSYALTISAACIISNPRPRTSAPGTTA
jgi:hypothetical protein